MTSRQRLRIVHLLEAPEAAPTLARWFAEEWAPWYGPDGPGDAQRDLAACSSRNELPICLLALNGDGDLLGTAALKSESIGSERGDGPWLAALLVAKTHRGLGVGTALVEAIEREARRLGFAALYTSTDSAVGMLERRGWQSFGSSVSLKGPVTIYRRQVKDRET